MTVQRSASVISFLTITLFAFSAGLLADSVDSRISAVTVYADRAIVTRTTSSQLAAGEHTLKFENLPTALVDQSLQASGFGVNGATILDVTAETIFVETTANERVKALEDQVRNLKKERRVLDDRSKILKEQHEFVQRMLQSSTNVPAVGAGGAGAARPSLDEWQKLYIYSEESLGKISGEQQAIDLQLENLQTKQTVLDQQLNELRGARGKQSKTVTVRVALTSPGKLDVNIKYSIPNASWTPAYDARLRSVDRAVDLYYFGIVRNGTGEDWKNVSLTLSTARPSLGGGAPQLQPWIADIARPRPSSASAGASALSPDQIRSLPIMGGDVLDLLTVLPGFRGQGPDTANAVSTKKSTPAPAAKESEAALSIAAVESNVSSATFKVPVAVTVPGTNISQKVAIKDVRLAATLQFQSTPRILEAAFLIAFTNNTTDYPLLAGPMNTFLDDTFVAASSLKTVMPGEKFEVALGVDDGISVKRRLINRFTEDSGFGNKTHHVTYEVVVTLTNNKATAETVVFKEPTPVSRDEKIVVKLLTPQEKEISTPTNPRDISREEDGKLVWRVMLKPGEKRDFSLKLSVEHPNDIAVSGLN